MFQRRLLLPRWLLRNSVMELNAQEDVAHMLDGTAALMACTVLPQLLIAHLLPKRLLLPKWLLRNSVMVLNAQEAAAHMLDGTAALMVCTVLPLLLTVHMPRIISKSWLQGNTK